MSLDLDWPNSRKEYTGVANPLYVSDIKNLTENLLQAMQAILGLNSTDFYIISGFTYTPGSPGSYSSGVCYINGVFYYSNTTLSETKYLAPSPTDVLSKTFPDTSTHYIYTVNYAVSANSYVSGYSPVFSGNMNSYRLNLKAVNNSLVNYGQPTDLGDKANPDFTNYDFTLDGNLHALDISVQIPTTAKYVLLAIQLTPTSNGYIEFSMYGNTNQNSIGMVTSENSATGTVYRQLWIAVDSNRKLAYRGYAGTSFDLTIMGWM